MLLISNMLFRNNNSLIILKPIRKNTININAFVFIH